MIIVTGAAGFIGSNLVLALNRRGVDDVLAVGELNSQTKHRNLNRAEILDFMEPEELIANLDQLGPVQAVFHEGACSDTTETDGQYMLRNNYKYTVKLAEWCRDRRIPFIYASSAAVYGNGDQGFAEARAAEDPLNVYGYSKFLFDQWMRRYWDSFESQVVGLRYFNVYGPQENHKGRMASVVYQFHHQIQDTGGLKVFEGSEGFLRDFVFIEDIVKINLHFLDHPEISGIFNAGTGTARSFMDMARLVAAGHGDAEISTRPFPKDLEGKYQAYTCADLSRLRDAGYDHPFTDLETGVAKYVDVLKSRGGYW